MRQMFHFKMYFIHFFNKGCCFNGDCKQCSILRCILKYYRNYSIVGEISIAVRKKIIEAYLTEKNKTRLRRYTQANYLQYNKKKSSWKCRK